MKHTMQSIKKLLNEWEIQFMVLLSFTLQVFLFFTGSLRRRSTNKLLNFIIWIAYLGADLVAIYALGFLSRHEDTTMGCETLRGVHQLAFFWAPFLLIHLGGQDTITAFSIEDNNFWRRHLLNLIVQVTLAIYVFWKSIDQYSRGLIASGIFVCVTGIIKYGERTMALMYGKLRNMDGVVQKNKNTSGSNTNVELEDGSHITEEVEAVQTLEQADVDYLGIVSFALQSAAGVRELFAGHTLQQVEDYQRSVLTSTILEAHMPKLLELELHLMYDDLFTKAQVIRTKSGIVLRSLSQMSMVVAFVLFLVSDYHGYSKADLTITYLLFSGAFFQEACAIFLLVMSPWTWSWLKARRCCGLAHVCKSLSSCIKKSEGRALWSNSMGQYNYLSYVGCEKSRLSKLVKRVARMTASLVGANEGKKPLLWLSNLLDTEHVKVDKTIMDSIIQTVYKSRGICCPITLDDPNRWPKIGRFLRHLLPTDLGASLGYGIVCFHIFTEEHLQRTTSSIDDVGHLVTACRNLSNYMLYLLVIRPEMLPVSGTTGPTIKLFLDKIAREDWHKQSLSTKMARAKRLLQGLGLSSEFEPPASRQTLEEIMSVWTALLVNSAGKSRAAVHATALSTGGELITFAWLLMAHKELGDVGQRYAFIVGAKVTKLGPWGGSRMFPEDMTEADASKRLESITVRSGWIVDSIAFTYIDFADEKHSAGPWGRNDGESHTIQLAESEFVTELSGTINAIPGGYTAVTSIKFVTNLNKTYGPWGAGARKDLPFAAPVPPGTGVVGFFACSGRYLDAIGVYVRPLPVTKLGTWGGSGGTPQDMTEADASKRLESITVRSGSLVHSIAFTYIDFADKEHSAGPWGGNGGESHTIQLAKSEFVTEMSGTIYNIPDGDYVVSSIKFVTNLNKTYGPWGAGARKDVPFTAPVPQGSGVVGFFGRSGDYLDAIGVYVKPL